MITRFLKLLMLLFSPSMSNHDFILIKLIFLFYCSLFDVINPSFPQRRGVDR